MFDVGHYVPVLRWKRAERAALKDLGYDERVRMTPLIEITPWGFEPENTRAGTNLQSKLPRIAEELLGHWGHGRIFLDLGLLSPGVRPTSGQHPIDLLFEAGRSNKVALVPVTGLDRDRTYQQATGRAAATDGFGVCLRIRRSDLERIALAKALDDLLDLLGVLPGQTDLIVDFGLATGAGPGVGYVTARVPRLREWRSFTVLAGAFPKDLSELAVGQHLIARTEWTMWSQDLKANEKSGRRMPTFGDYAIQHHRFSEPIPGMNVSASIRYTTTDDWLVLRGEGLRNKDGPKHAQYGANAQLLVERKEFCGADFSEGDAYIWRACAR